MGINMLQSFIFTCQSFTFVCQSCGYELGDCSCVIPCIEETEYYE